jgi:hypothetical protein
VRRRPATASVSVLPFLALASYGTSFLRDVYLLRQALGNVSLDAALLFMLGAAVGANVCGGTLSGLWIGGRACSSKLYLGYGMGGLAGILLMAMGNGPVGAMVIIGFALATFELSRVRAASIGRQSYAFLGAIFAVIPTLVSWEVVGVQTTTGVLLGFTVGAVWQAGVAGVAARSAPPRRPGGPGKERRYGVAFLVHTAMVQINAMTDRLAFSQFPAGLVAAGTFAYNVADAVTIVSTIPLSAELLGKRDPRQLRRLAIALGALGALAAAIVAPGLAVLISGGSANSGERWLLVQLIWIYAAGVPFACVWSFAHRAASLVPSSWRRLAGISAASVITHVAIVGIAIVYRSPLMVVGSWVVSMAQAALLARRYLAKGPFGNE